MYEYLSPELIVTIKNAVDRLPNLLTSQSECIMYTKRDDYYVVCNISEKKKLTALSVIMDSNSFIENLLLRGSYYPQINFYILLNYRMSTFIFESHCLTGVYHQTYRNKSFHYYNGKKQKEKTNE